mmetsp:Transcript_49936/g.67948  ORF Transcript_49936/g.67948 Transcript_49936/m.67948 type:complete len:289 (+) Transcript_49936:526-1392(+)
MHSDCTLLLRLVNFHDFRAVHHIKLGGGDDMLFSFGPGRRLQLALQQRVQPCEQLALLHVARLVPRNRRLRLPELLRQDLLPAYLVLVQRLVRLKVRHKAPIPAFPLVLVLDPLQRGTLQVEQAVEVVVPAFLLEALLLVLLALLFQLLALHLEAHRDLVVRHFLVVVLGLDLVVDLAHLPELLDLGGELVLPLVQFRFDTFHDRRNFLQRLFFVRVQVCCLLRGLLKFLLRGPIPEYALLRLQLRQKLAEVLVPPSENLFRAVQQHGLGLEILEFRLVVPVPLRLLP